MKRITYRKYIENGPKRGGPAVWDPVCKLVVPCSSRGGYHVCGGGGGWISWLALCPYSGSLGMLG